MNFNLELADGEKVIAVLDSELMVLTDSRLKFFNGAGLEDIALHKVTAVNLVQGYHYWIAISATVISFALALPKALYEANSGYGVLAIYPGLSLAAAAIIVYLLPKQKLVIEQASGAIEYDVAGLGLKRIASFIELIEQAIPKAASLNRGSALT